MPPELVNVSIAGGIDQSRDPRQVEAPYCLVATNVQISKAGAIEKRRGFTSFGNGSGTAALPVYIASLATRNRELIAIGRNLTAGETSLSSFAPALTDTWRDRGRVPLFKATIQGAVGRPSPIANYDYAVGSGLTCDFFTDTATTIGHILIRDEVTGAVVETREYDLALFITGAGGRGSLKVVYVDTADGHFFFVYVTDGGDISYRVYNCTSRTFGSVVSLAAATTSPSRFGIDVRSGVVFLAYQGTATDIRLRRYTISGTTVTQTHSSDETMGASSATSIAVKTSSTRVWVAGGIGGTGHAKIYARSLAALAADVALFDLFTVDAGEISRLTMTTYSNTALVDVYAGVDADANGLAGRLYFRGYNSGTGAVGSLQKRYGATLFSTTFLLGENGETGGGARVILYHREYEEGCYLLCQFDVPPTGNELGETLAVLNPRLAVKLDMQPHCVNVYASSLGATSVIGKAVLAPEITTAFNPGVTVDRVTLETASTGRVSNANLGDVLYLSGGFQYEGQSPHEIAFPWAPKIESITDAAGAVTDGTRLYVAIAEWTDINGVRHYSAVSKPFSYTNAVNKKMTVKVQTIAMTQRHIGLGADAEPSFAYLLLYRTVSAGSLFYRVSGANYETASSGAERNDRDAATVNIDDNVTDASLTDGTHPFLYTTGGVLSAQSPGAIWGLITHRGRIFGIDPDCKTVWFSQRWELDSQPGFNDLLTMTVPDNGQPITALGSLDTSLIVFQKRAIFVVQGDGPPKNGIGGDFSTPERLPCDVGCEEPRSVVTTPLGLMFMSERGIYLLGRDLQVKFIGVRVEDTTATWPICTSAVLVPGTSHVRFTMTNLHNQAAEGVTLVYDYEADAWTAWQHNGIAATNGHAIMGAVMHPTYGYCNAIHDIASGGARVRQESTSSSLEEGRWVPSSIETGWFKTSLNGEQETPAVFLLGTRRSAAGIDLSFAFDYENAYTDTAHSYTEATVTTLDASGVNPIRLRLSPKRQYSGALRLRVSDSSPATLGDGHGLSWSGIGIEVVPKPNGFQNLPAAAKT